MNLHLRSDARDEARALVLEHHYSHKWPAVPLFSVTWHESGGLFGDRGVAVAAAVFGIPANAWAEPVWEFQRLVRRPGLGVPLTGLIGAAASEIRRQGRVDLLVSYADREAGHHGGIYQAASWHYAGLKPDDAKGGRVIGCVIDGERIHGRVLSHRYGTRSAKALRARGLDAELWRDDSRKHLYWRALNRRGKAKAKRLGLKSLPYPKPGRAA